MRWTIVPQLLPNSSDCARDDKWDSFIYLVSKTLVSKLRLHHSVCLLQLVFSFSSFKDSILMLIRLKNQKPATFSSPWSSWKVLNLMTKIHKTTWQVARKYYLIHFWWNYKSNKKYSLTWTFSLSNNIYVKLYRLGLLTNGMKYVFIANFLWIK